MTQGHQSGVTEKEMDEHGGAPAAARIDSAAAYPHSNRVPHSLFVDNGYAGGGTLSANFQHAGNVQPNGSHLNLAADIAARKAEPRSPGK